tara:strand:+ start:392 stop:787 length:396 start_codon:yes stop_codon:yes gene_type:complete
MLVKPEKKNPRINIVPLIDIIFLMLVFFMLATNFDKSKQIDFSIDKRLGVSNQDEKILFIKVKNNNFRINDEQIKKKNFESKVLNFFGKKKFDRVLILNDTNSNIETLIFAIDVLKKNNVSNVSFSNDLER